MFLSFALFYPLLNNPAFPLLFFPGYVNFATPGLRWLFTLPISRRSLCLRIVAPFLALYAAGLLLNDNFGIGSSNPSQVFKASGGQMELAAVTPWEARAGVAAPVIVSPWGETYQPRIDRILLFDFYDPWSWGERNSKEFRDWQFRRATAAIYGREVSLTNHSELERMRPVTQSPGMQLLRLAFFGDLSLLAAAMGLIPAWRRLNRFSTTQLSWFSGVVFLAPMMVLMLLPRVGKTSADIALIFNLIAVHAPRATTILVIGLLAPLAWLTDRMFLEMEPDARHSKAPMQGFAGFRR
jgi:hypothetical protein